MDVTLDHPFFSAKKQIFKLCKPLFAHTKITFFGYARYYYDGQAIFLSQAPEVDCEVIRLNLVPRVEELHLNTSRYVFLSTLFQSMEATLYPEIYLRNIAITRDAGIFHRLFVVNNFENYVETHEFGVGNTIKNVIEFFMNYIQVLERFCIYFREGGADLIEQMSENKVIFDSVTDPVLFIDMKFKNEVYYNNLLQEIKLTKYRIQGRGTVCSLSEREFECLLWSAKDKTAKQIARILSLSPRTVEDYLIKIKNKLNCESKHDLLDVAAKNSIIQSFIS